jgi:hypothetical protein
MTPLSSTSATATRSRVPHPEPLLPLLCLHSALRWPGLFEGLDVVIHLAAYSLAVPFPEQGKSQLHNTGTRATLVFNLG